MVLPWGPACWYRHREPCAEETQTASAQVTRVQTASHQCPGYGCEELVRTPRRLCQLRGEGLATTWAPSPPPRAASPAHLDAILLQVQVPRVDGDTGRDLGQLPPCADHPAGLVAAGAGRGAGGGRRGAPSGGRCPGHAAPAGPQGWGEEPEEEQGPMGPGHPTGRQWGARGAAGTRHPQCSCSAWAPGGCQGERGRGSVRDGDPPSGPASPRHPGRSLRLLPPPSPPCPGSGPKGARLLQAPCGGRGHP